MALAIIRGESYDIGLILENIALEIITGGVSTANVTISSDVITFEPNVSVYVPWTLYKLTFI